MPHADDSLWRLEVRHRSGSLEEAVSAVRRKNLAISFGVLLILGASMALVIISSQRAVTLARQQIEFVAGVSHELRTPVAVIGSLSENMADGLVTDAGQVKRYGAQMKSEGRRLADMIEQVLAFAGTRSIKKAFHARPTAVATLIEQALAASGAQIREGGFDVEVDVQSDLPRLMVDGGAMSRAVQNLLGNAMKYSGEIRWIGVQARTAQSKRGQEVLISVRDRGRGIESADLPHIFEPFRRGRAAVEAQIHGNGLGLCLVKRIITAHGGKIEVQSAVGHGSVFTLRLPVIKPGPEANAPRFGDKYGQPNSAC